MGSDVPCLASCYVGGDGCEELETWLPYSGAISMEQYCSLKWAEIDEAYEALRVCASKAIAKPKSASKEEYVNATQNNRISSNSCGFNYCASKE
jgi:hypothetical protein